MIEAMTTHASPAHTTALPDVASETALPESSGAASAAFSFALQAQEPTPFGAARAGLFQTPHGEIPTPVFMPVGTQTTVKSLTWLDLAETAPDIVLCNAFHVGLRPGPDLVEKAGGLHGWMNWQKPILTDSGGFQVFSLAKLRDIQHDGVRFKDPKTGAAHFIGPKESMRIQNQLGADIIMAFDECAPYPATLEHATKAMHTTHRWLESCWTAHARHADQALFPIVQGSTFTNLREQSAAYVQQFPAVGFAIGGVSVGEPRPHINAIVAHTTPLLPADKPRYLMGVGTPEDLLAGIRRGVDMFDCVIPTRNGRHGTYFTPWGKEHIKHAKFAEDFAPLVPECDCWTCRHHHRAYLRHLFKQGETTAMTLMSLHNVHFLVTLVRQAREAILAGTFEAFFATTMARLGFPDDRVVALPSGH